MSDTLALISDARRALAEAQTLPDIRRVMEAAKVATDAMRRQAKLAEGQQMAAEVVQAAEEAANDAAAVRIEAQARAGRDPVTGARTREYKLEELWQMELPGLSDVIAESDQTMAEAAATKVAALKFVKLINDTPGAKTAEDAQRIRNWNADDLEKYLAS